MSSATATPSTYINDDRLPCLPVPALDSTVAKYVRTLEPYVSRVAEDGQSVVVDEAAMERLRATGRDFVNTLGAKLHQRLLAYARSQPDNWLDRWWLQYAYHAWREPLLVNSNWFTVFANHPAQPAPLLHPKLAMVPAGHVTPFQIHRSAGLVTNALNMKEAIERGTIPAEIINRGKTPLSMNRRQEYKLMFGWTRVPLPDMDTVVNPGGFPSTSHHIIVLFRDQAYVVDVYNVQTGGRLTVADVERQLWAVVNDAMNTPRQPSVCILTSEHRDNWAAARAYMVKHDAVNKNNFGLIESALFVLCLDDRSLPDQLDVTFQNMAHSFDGHNRWFDKTISVICMSNGKAGMNGEHSPCDALIPSRMMDWLIENEPAKDPSDTKSGAFVNAPYKLKWAVDDTILGFIDKANVAARKICDDSDCGVLIFTGYGSEFIKTAKVSPDSFVQMAMQLAFYRMHKTWCPTYETASTRQFKLGRTETIRTCSPDSIRFVQTFCNNRATSRDKYMALVAASKAHTKYTVEAMRGEGVDRHIFGMKMCLQSGEDHPFLSDPVARGSTNYRLSTSSLSSGELYLGTGFGSAVPDGYGVNYCIGKGALKFGIESKKSCRETSTARFKHALIDALYDMKRMVADVSPAAVSVEASKL